MHVWRGSAYPDGEVGTSVWACCSCGSRFRADGRASEVEAAAILWLRAHSGYGHDIVPYWSWEARRPKALVAS